MVSHTTALAKQLASTEMVDSVTFSTYVLVVFKRKLMLVHKLVIVSTTTNQAAGKFHISYSFV